VHRRRPERDRVHPRPRRFGIGRRARQPRPPGALRAEVRRDRQRGLACRFPGRLGDLQSIPLPALPRRHPRRLPRHT
ncbi:hypothetical protein LTR53_020556, partial [Teratosphaeriaceae sp. CCFEE 6253]